MAPRNIYKTTFTERLQRAKLLPSLVDVNGQFQGNNLNYIINGDTLPNKNIGYNWDRTNIKWTSNPNCL